MPISRRSLPVIVLILFLLLTLILTGCGQSKTQGNISSNQTTNNSSPTPGSTPNNSQTPASDTSSISTGSVEKKITLYFPASDANGLVPVERTVKMNDQEIIKTMFEELSNPPAGLDKALPNGTRLLDAHVENGVATLNLSQEFRKNFNGGSAGEQMVLFSIIDTLTTLPNVQSVQFLLEGEKKAAILHETDTSTPLKRNESLIIKQ